MFLESLQGEGERSGEAARLEIKMKIKNFSKMVVGRWKMAAFLSPICDFPSVGAGGRVWI